MPKTKPMEAGNTDQAPFASSISIAGMSNDHTDAATITPDAKPSRDFCRRSGISPFIKKTKAEPSMVPMSGMSSPRASDVIMSGEIKLYAVAKIRLFLLSDKSQTPQSFERLS